MPSLFRKYEKQLASSRACIAESKRLLASIRADLKTRNALASSRACIAESKQLFNSLAETIPTALFELDRIEARTAPDRSPGMLSVRVFEKGSRFGWTVSSRTKDLVGVGTAETEHKARIDALRAGMTYIERAKGRSSSSDTSLH